MYSSTPLFYPLDSNGNNISNIAVKAKVNMVCKIYK